jgi:hypothetical protein
MRRVCGSARLRQQEVSVALVKIVARDERYSLRQNPTPVMTVQNSWSAAAGRRLKIQAAWPWAEAITAAWQRVDALPQAP